MGEILRKIKCLLRSILFICFLNETVLGARTTLLAKEESSR